MRVQTKVFQSKQSQAVCLPKPVVFPAAVKEVEITIINRSRLISPAGESWDSWFDGESVSSDFVINSDQPMAK